MVEVIERHRREASDDPHLGGVQWEVHSGPDVIPRAMSGSCCFSPISRQGRGLGEIFIFLLWRVKAGQILVQHDLLSWNFAVGARQRLPTITLAN